MKTNVIMLSPDRELFGIKVRQQTGTGFLNLSDLQNAYNVARESFDWAQKRVDHFFEHPDNCERVYELLKEMGKVNVELSTFTESLRKSPVKYMKSLGIWKTTKKEGVSVDPYVWVSIALWMNPKIYAKTVIWLADSLLAKRIEAGDMYRGLSNAISGFPDCDYIQVAKALNHIVFGFHAAGIRQAATTEQLNELADVEKKMAWAIDMGYIETQEQLIVELRKMWIKKFNSKFLKLSA